MSRTGELDLTPLETLDLKSRDEWSRACAVTLIQVLKKNGCQILAARGFQEFLRCSAPVFSPHQFKQEDYRRMFDLIVYASEHPITPELILTHNARTRGRTR